MGKEEGNQNTKRKRIEKAKNTYQCRNGAATKRAGSNTELSRQTHTFVEFGRDTETLLPLSFGCGIDRVRIAKKLR